MPRFTIRRRTLRTIRNMASRLRLMAAARAAARTLRTRRGYRSAAELRAGRARNIALGPAHFRRIQRNLRIPRLDIDSYFN